MARPKKQGIEYFPFDTDFFSDIKVRRISRACGPSSTSILICLLCNIYKDKGYYILWDENLPFVVADTIGTTEGAVEEVVKKSIQVGFFDKDLFEKHRILTSNGIQSRFKSAVKRREEIEYVVEYLVIDNKNRVSVCKNGVIDDRSTQSKVNRNKSKVKEKKQSKETPTKVGEKKDAAKAATLSRKDSFYQSLVPFVGKYPKEMIHEFFDYWSELNKSQTKMRFEQQPTWEVAKRLATWAKREKDYGKSSNEVQQAGDYSNKRAAQNKAASRQSLEYLADAILGQPTP